MANERNADRARSLWQETPANCCNYSPVCLHGDFKSGNLISKNGKLRGVIHWGLSAIWVPAADYGAEWSLVNPSARGVFREGQAFGEDDWQRAESWALYGAVIDLASTLQHLSASLSVGI